MLEKLTLREKQALEKISDALRRIEEGTFGFCVECEEPIPEKRIIAVPDCTMCIGCAELIEREARQYRQN